MKKKTLATALRTCCAERTGTMLRSGMCASYTCTVFFIRLYVGKDMEVQV